MLTLRTRPLAAILLSCTAVGATAPDALAATAKKASSKTIVADCKKDGTISHRYRLSDLKAAQKVAKKDRKAKSKCGPALTSAVAGLSGKKGSSSINAVYRDCLKGSHALTHRFTASTLKKASKKIPADIANYGDGTCSKAISSQLHTISG